MQIIEVSVTGVRSAVWRLTRRAAPLQFVIFPMVHIGEPAFYAAVTERLRRRDQIVAEGRGQARLARRIGEFPAGRTVCRVGIDCHRPATWS